MYYLLIISYFPIFLHLPEDNFSGIIHLSGLRRLNITNIPKLGQAGTHLCNDFFFFFQEQYLTQSMFFCLEFGFINSFSSADCLVTRK